MKSFQGRVIGNKMKRAAVVEIQLTKKHPLYKKRMKIIRKIHVQDSFGVKIGDLVKIVECRPVSKTIAFKITEVIS